MAEESEQSSTPKGNIFKRFVAEIRRNPHIAIGIVVAVLTLIVGIMMYRRMQGQSSAQTASDTASLSPTTSDTGGGGPDLSGLLDALTKAATAGGAGIGVPGVTPDTGGGTATLPVFDTSSGGWDSSSFNPPPTFSTPSQPSGGSTPQPSALPTFHAPSLDASGALGALGSGLGGFFHNVTTAENTVAGAAGGLLGRIAGTAVAAPRQAVIAAGSTSGRIAAAVAPLPGKGMELTGATLGTVAGAYNADVQHVAAGAGYAAGSAAKAIYSVPILGGLLQRINPPAAQPPKQVSIPAANYSTAAHYRPGITHLPPPPTPRPITVLSDNQPMARRGGPIAF